MLISFAIKAFKPSFLRAFTVAKYTPPIALIKKLREDTGSPINECKIALEINEGDLEKAKEHLKAKGLSQAQKRLNKIAQEGVIGVSFSPNKKFSVMAEVFYIILPDKNIFFRLIVRLILLPEPTFSKILQLDYWKLLQKIKSHWI